MRKLATVAALCILTAGCGVDQLILTQAEQQDLADNVVAAIEAYQALADFTLAVALGQVEVAGSEYTEPSEANAWTGTLAYDGDQFPGGTGSMLMTFQVFADGALVDPFAFDFSGTGAVTLDMSVSFDGVSEKGAPLLLSCDFTMDITQEAGTAAAVTINGDFEIGHNAYTANLRATDFAFAFDVPSEALVAITGALNGAMDVPDYAFDADLDIAGRGDRVDFSVSVPGGGVRDSVTIDELVGTGA